MHFRIRTALSIISNYILNYVLLSHMRHFIFLKLYRKEFVVEFLKLFLIQKLRGPWPWVKIIFSKLRTSNSQKLNLFDNALILIVTVTGRALVPLLLKILYFLSHSLT
jgi:hypothetical protein